MNHYTCPACGQTSYSAAREADMIDPSCPYCGWDTRLPAHKKTAPNGNSEAAERELIQAHYRAESEICQ